MNACEARGGYEKRGGGGGGGCCPFSARYEKRGGVAVRFTPDAKSEWERGVLSASRKVGGGAACRTMIYIVVCARVRDSAWGVERGGGGRQLVPGGGISYEWGGRPPPPSLCWIRG